MVVLQAFFESFFQAQARCHRIGQSKAVKVYRLITRNSYEREMLDKASLKLGLDRAVLQSMSGNKDSNVNGVRNLIVINLNCQVSLRLVSYITSTNLEKKYSKSSLVRLCQCLSVSTLADSAVLQEGD